MMTTRDEPMTPIPVTKIKPLCEWRCTVPAMESAEAKDDPALRRGTYVRARTPGEAAQVFVEHEGLRVFEVIHVQRWRDILGTPTSPGERRQIVQIRGGGRFCP